MKKPQPRLTASVGVRDLKASLSAYLRRARAGDALTVTDRGEPIARIIPAGLSPGVEQLIREGRLRWSGRKPEITTPGVKLRVAGVSASDLIVRMRREREEALQASPSSRRRGRAR